MAPTSQRRLGWRRKDDKAEFLRVANTMAVAGTVVLAASLTGAMFLIGDLVFDATWAAILGAAGAVALSVLWFVIPMVRRRRRAD